MARVSAQKETVFNRVVLVAITALCLLFVFLVSRTFLGSDKIAIANPSTPTASIARAHQLELDSDGDGVPDWEEILYGSDPYDPKSVPGKKSARVASADYGVGAYEDKPSTATDMLAREVMTELMVEYKKKGGAPHHNLSHQKMVGEAVGKLSAYVYTPNNSLFESLRIVPSTEDANITYLKAIESMLTHVAEKSASEYEALLLVINGSENEGAGMLKKSVSIYETMISQMLDLAVPESAVRIHKDAVSAIERYKIACNNLSHIGNDPVLAMLGLDDFMPSQLHLVQKVGALAQYRERFYESIGMVLAEPPKQTFPGAPNARQIPRAF